MIPRPFCLGLFLRGFVVSKVAVYLKSQISKRLLDEILA